MSTTGSSNSTLMNANGVPAATRAFLGWRVAVIAFLAENVAVGVTYGSYGPILTQLQSTFATSRSLASSGLSLAPFITCALSPLIGWLLHRWSVRGVMAVGALLNFVGYACLFFVEDIYQVLAVYGLLIGPGISALAVIPASTLISRWFVKGRGRILGFVNMPFAMFLWPMVASTVLSNFGLRSVFLANALIFVALLPVLLFIVDSPESVGQRAHGADDKDVVAKPIPDLSVSAILRRRDFWLLAFATTILTGAATTIAIHLTPAMMDAGLSLQTASLALSLYGIGGIVGGPTFGWLADRMGPLNTLAVNAFCLVGPFALMIAVPSNTVTYLCIAAMFGLCNGALTGLHGGVVNRLFGVPLFSRVMGLGYFFKMPVMAAAAPFAGYMVDVSGSYDLAFMVIIGLLVAANVALALLRRMEGQGD